MPACITPSKRLKNRVKKSNAYSFLIPTSSMNFRIRRTPGYILSTMQLLGCTNPWKSTEAGLAVHHGNPIEVWKQIAETSPVEKVFANRDYEPYATQRDQSVKELVIQQGGGWADFKDHVVFEADEVLKADGAPYTVFTPYSRKWMEKTPFRNGC